jgi:AAA family ATP:ADP antiporter
MSADAVPAKGSTLDRALRLFADVRPGEGATTVLLAANLFLILTAYYVLKPVREALILGQASPELKSYLSAAQVAVLFVAVPAYGRLVSQWPRRRLINIVNWMFIGCLLAFFALGQAGVSIGIVYFVWIGVFNLMIVAQFWSFANDLYSRNEGERLFPVVGAGAALGGVLGAYVAGMLIHPLGLYELLLVGAALLAAQLQITNYVDRRSAVRVVEEDATGPDITTAESTAAPTAHVHENAFAMVFRTPYLRGMAAMVLLIATVDAMGEYILGTIVKDAAVQYVAEGRSHGLDVPGVIGAFYSRYYFLINVTSVVLQFFFVSRIVKYAGVPAALAILPLVSLSAYNVMAFVPSLWVVLGAKVAEKGTTYSLNNTVQNMLYLPCTRQEKYSAKQAIDAFFFRMGDVCAALLVVVGTGMSLGAAGFAKTNIVLAAAWLAVAWIVGRRYSRRQTSPPRRTAGVLSPVGTARGV